MLTQNDIREAAVKIAPQYDIKQVYLFGSFARGDATDESDVDFRIVGGDIRDLYDLGGLYEDFMEILGRKVDIVLSKNIKPEFYEKIRNDEVIIYDGV